jgi:hypothetical protein
VVVEAEPVCKEEVSVDADESIASVVEVGVVVAVVSIVGIVVGVGLSLETLK